MGKRRKEMERSGGSVQSLEMGRKGKRAGKRTVLDEGKKRKRKRWRKRQKSGRKTEKK